VSDENNATLVVQELHPISASMGDYVTIKVHRWEYYISRGKLTLIEGLFNKDELEEAERKCNLSDHAVEGGEPPIPDTHRHFILTVRWNDLVELAEQILSLRTEWEKKQSARS
jgi:hypothetical protein